MHPHLLLLFCAIYSCFLLLRDTLISSSFFSFFFEGYTSTVPLFSRRHPHKPFSFSGVHLHSSFYPGSTHASVPPAFFFFFPGMHSGISSSFFVGCTPHLLLFPGCTPTSSSFFLQDTLTQLLLLWDELTVCFFFQDAFKHLLLCFPTLKPYPSQGPVAPRLIGNYSLCFLKDPNSSTPKEQPHAPKKPPLRMFSAK